MDEAREVELLQKIGDQEQKINELEQRQNPLVGVVVCTVLYNKRTGYISIANVPSGFKERAEMANVLRKASAFILDSLK